MLHAHSEHRPVRDDDDRGLLLEEIDPLGRTTQHTYDVKRNELARKNAIGEVTTFTYDANGNQTSIANARAETIHITYNAFSQPLTWGSWRLPVVLELGIVAAVGLAMMAGAIFQFSRVE